MWATRLLLAVPGIRSFILNRSKDTDVRESTLKHIEHPDTWIPFMRLATLYGKLYCGKNEGRSYLNKIEGTAIVGGSHPVPVLFVTIMTNAALELLTVMIPLTESKLDPDIPGRVMLVKGVIASSSNKQWVALEYADLARFLQDHLSMLESSLLEKVQEDETVGSRESLGLGRALETETDLADGQTARAS